jgi:hypothetical protein
VQRFASAITNTTLFSAMFPPGFPIKGNAAQNRNLKALLASGELVSGKSTLKFGQSNVRFDEKGLHLPNGLTIALGKKTSRRNLAVVTGVKPILVVKVISLDGLARSESPAQIGDDIFGTLTDPVNLASQMKACSFGQLDIVPGNGTAQEAPGVITVSIPVTLANSRSVIRNAVTAAAQAKLDFSLPGPYQQVMYVLHSCQQDCGFAAYAYINSWNSVYQAQYYKQTGVLMHGEYICRHNVCVSVCQCQASFFSNLQHLPLLLPLYVQRSAITSILHTAGD